MRIPQTLLGLLTMGAIGVVGFRYLDRRPPGPAATIVTPIPTVVTVPITTPAPIVNVTVPQPEPPPAPFVPPPRMLTPYLEAECLLPGPDTETSPEACSTGLPAISPDGTTIAILANLDDGGRGYPHTEMRFLDVATSKVVRTRSLVDPNELDQEGHATPEVVAKVRKAVAAMKKQLVGYRTLVLVERRAADSPTEHGLYVEHDLAIETRSHGLLRVVDADAHAVLVQERFLVTDEYPTRKVDPDTDTGCYPSRTYGTGAYWDARTRLILVEVNHGASSCWCSGATHYYARIAPTP